MKYLLFFFVFTFTSLSTNFAQQDKIEQLVSEGIQLHDRGNYKAAIEKYEEELQLDENNSLVHYEIAYTCMMSKEYEKSLYHCDKALEFATNEKYLIYVVKGSVLDLMGEIDKSIELYEEAIELFPDKYLLYYNLAITANNNKDYDKAESAAINSIKLNPLHPSSHLILGYVMDETNKRISSILSIYYFLILEPDSRRTSQAWNLLQSLIEQGISQENDNRITISINPDTDYELSFAEIMLSMLSVSRTLDDNSSKTDEEWFIYFTDTFFKMLSESKEDVTGFWREFYLDFFSDMVATDNVEAFCYIISKSTKSDSVYYWLSENSEKINKFWQWFEDYER
ncbi:MAG: tetratricopeptide repeat protein [Ignavibacteriales bacterium]|nr:tetratricopeptide repeat protein [Ignavibacteriales bacterium]